MNKKNMAPLVLFVYNRPQHLKRALEAIENNTLIEDTDLYIFSDGVKDNDDSVFVLETRKIIEDYVKVSGFSSVTVECSDKNKGLANSIISGVSKVIRRYGKVIVLEDDIIVSAGFIQYMNQALNYYEKNDRIWSIAGNSFELNSLKNYKEDVFLLPRISSWGWGTWKNRWESMDWSIDYFTSHMSIKKNSSKLMLGGSDLRIIAEKYINGQSSSWAIRWALEAAIRDKYTVYPSRTFISNSGFDGSGTNCGKDGSKQINCLLPENPNIVLKEIEPCVSIINEFRKHYSYSVLDRIKHGIKTGSFLRTRKEC